MKTPIALIIILLLGFGAFLYFEDSLFITPTEPEKIEETEDTQPEETPICIQVITPARNIETEEIKEFPTPCDVPEGWEEIAPEGFELDLQTI